MKNIILLLPILLLTACDAPQRTRAPSNFVNGSNYQDTNNKNGTFSPTPTTTGTTSGGTAIGSGPGFENCDLGDKYHTIDTGFFGLCQSTQDETSFKFRPSLSSSSIRTCLIPTFKDTSGSSTWIGQPQCTYTTANQVVSGKLYKDRQGFSNYPLNGVIVMKEPLLPEYFNCMQAYVDWPQRNICKNGPTTSYCAYWLPRCPYGAKTNAACDAEGRSYMNNVCSSFKTKYPNSYIDIRTK